jgi:hypothetical protein
MAWAFGIGREARDMGDMRGSFIINDIIAKILMGGDCLTVDYP